MAGLVLVDQASEDCDALRAVSDTGPLPDVPATLISGSTGRNRSRGMWAQISQSHQRPARALPRGRHVWAERSGHMVPMEAPDLVVEETMNVLKSA